MTPNEPPQHLPVRLYRTDDRVLLAAPMPGLEADDIEVEVVGRTLSVHGRERGSGQHERDLLIAEWNVGPYGREVELPEPVDGALANATYGNGVLVVSLPTARDGEGKDVRFRLRPTTATRGERVGHRGRDADPVDEAGPSGR